MNNWTEYLEDILKANARLNFVPKTFSDCQNFPRPCLWNKCRFHLQPLVIGDKEWKWKKSKEKIKILYEMKETCVLDVIEKNNFLTREEIQDLLIFNRSSGRIVEGIIFTALRKLRNNLFLKEWHSSNAIVC